MRFFKRRFSEGKKQEEPEKKVKLSFKEKLIILVDEEVKKREEEKKAELEKEREEKERIKKETEEVGKKIIVVKEFVNSTLIPYLEDINSIIFFNKAEIKKLKNEKNEFHGISETIDTGLKTEGGFIDLTLKTSAYINHYYIELFWGENGAKMKSLHREELNNQVIEEIEDILLDYLKDKILPFKPLPLS